MDHIRSTYIFLLLLGLLFSSIIPVSCLDWDEVEEWEDTIKAEPTEWIIVEDFSNTITQYASQWFLVETWNTDITAEPKEWEIVETFADTIEADALEWSTVHTWNNEISAEASPNYSGGDGTSSDPYQITTWEQLAYCHNCSGSYFILMNDLDEESTGYDDYAGSTANTNTGWLPLGRSNTSYKIYLDGNDHIISDLYIDRSADHQGFIAYNIGGYIKNLGIKNATVKGNSELAVLCVTASDCDVENVFVSDSLIYGYGTSNNSYIGGMFWRIQNTTGTHYVKNCYCETEITYDNTLTGYVKIGGFTHDTTLTASTYSIEDCYAVTDISTTTGSETLQAGGFNLFTNGYYKISDCYYDTTVGPATSEEGTGKTTTQLKDIDTFLAWDISAVTIGNDTDHVWNIVDDSDYPFLSSLEIAGSGWNIIETWENTLGTESDRWNEVEEWRNDLVNEEETTAEPLVPISRLVTKVILPFALLFVPAFALASRFGAPGFIIGAMLGVFCLYLGTGIPLGLVILAIFVLAGIWYRMD